MKMNISQTVLTHLQTARNASSKQVQLATGLNSAQIGAALRDHTLAGRFHREKDKSYTFIHAEMGTQSKKKAAAPAPATQEQIVYLTQLTPGQVEVIPPTQVAQPNLNAVVDEVGKNLAGQIINVLEASLKKWLAEQLTALVSANAPSYLTLSKSEPPSKPEQKQVINRLPKICVCGLMPQQAGMIQTEFHQTFDLTFWNNKQGDSNDSLLANGKNCEAVFLHIDHSAHHIENTLKSVRAKIVKVPGGMTAMRDALTNYFIETAA